MTLPKPRALRQRRNRVVNSAELTAPPVTRIPLPERQDEQAWHPMTLSWWETIWASPMADEWVDADVPGLLALASLVEMFWVNGDPRVAAEIRMQQREYGLSPLSRRQLQWEIKRVTASEPKMPATPVRTRRGTRSTLSVLQGRIS